MLQIRAALLLCVALAACSDDSPDPRTAEAAQTSPPSVATALAEAVPGAVEALPVPAVAVREPGVDDDPNYAMYLLPEGVSADALNDWYRVQLPDGEPFGTWTWCRTELIAQQIDRIYHHPGTTDILGLTISQNDPDDGGQAFVMLARDQSGPAHC